MVPQDNHSKAEMIIFNKAVLHKIIACPILNKETRQERTNELDSLDHNSYE